VTRDLSQDREIDFARERLDFEALRALARNPHLDVHGKIGFATGHREGFEPAILQDIVRKLPVLLESEGATVVDVGPGCANLPKMIIDLCRERRHRLVLVDSEEMLAQLPDVEGVTFKCAGEFPKNRAAVEALAPGGCRALICYSVLQVVFLGSNPFDFVDGLAALLAPGGRALIGDIPNESKRRRFFASDAGKAFHRAYTGRDEDPPQTFNTALPGKIDDAVLHGLAQRAQAAGFDAYLLPQPGDLPMANRRDDLLIVRP
jgi:hypothetical protein